MKHLGNLAEDLAVAYLAAFGMTILGRNIRTPDGEIDILARDGQDIVVVEVKARRSSRFGSAVSAVNARKRQRLRAAAANLAQFAPVNAGNWRFDVVTIERGQVRHYQAAF
jgi:putative endonuclease